MAPCPSSEFRFCRVVPGKAVTTGRGTCWCDTDHLILKEQGSPLGFILCFGKSLKGPLISLLENEVS